MPLIIDHKSLLKLERNKRRKRPKRVLAKKSMHKQEKQLRQGIEDLWRRMVFPVVERFKEAVRAGASAEELTHLLDQSLAAVETQFGLEGRNVVDLWRQAVDDETRHKLNAALSRSLGIDSIAILDTQEVREAFTIGSYDAVSLIETIPQYLHENVRRAIVDNFRGVELPEGRSLLQQIEHIGQVSRRRARVIARDQTSKLTAEIDKARQQSLGIDHYIWRTVKDQRVVGNPNGLYPVGNDKHGNHYIMEGKVFSYSDPTVYAENKNGKLVWKKRTAEMSKNHPGYDIQCRCYAEPIIDVEEIVKHAQSF